MLSTFDEPTRVAIQENLFEFGNALAGRGPDLNAALGELPERARVPRAGDDATSPSPDTELERFITAQRRGRGRGRAGRRDPGAAVRHPRHHVHRARRGRAARSSRRRSPRRRRPSPPASGRCPVIRPFLAHSADAVHRRCSRASETLAATAPTIADDARDRHPGAARLAALNRSSPPTAAGAARASTTTRTSATGSPACARRPTSSARRSASSPRRRRSATTRRCSSATPASLFSQGSPRRPLAAVHGLRPARRARTTRAASPRRPANGGGDDARNFLHYNPYPNTAAPGQTRECEAGNEPYIDRPAGDRQRRRATRARSPTGAARAARTTEEEPVRRRSHAEATAPRPEQAGARSADLGPQVHAARRRGSSAC